MKNIYLCARVAKDAQEQNDKVASALRSAGYRVYVPHEQDVNRSEERDTKAIFLSDYAAMRKAHAFVAVGRMGADCGWELGYAWAKGIPVVHVPVEDISWTESPMLIPTLCQYKQATVDTVVTKVNIATYEEVM